MTDNYCCYCGHSDVELRPFGPDGNWSCLDCTMMTEENRKTAQHWFLMQPDALPFRPVRSN